MPFFRLLLGKCYEATAYFLNSQIFLLLFFGICEYTPCLYLIRILTAHPNGNSLWGGVGLIQTSVALADCSWWVGYTFLSALTSWFRGLDYQWPMIQRQRGKIKEQWHRPVTTSLARTYYRNTLTPCNPICFPRDKWRYLGNIWEILYWVQ